ncbi:MAG: CotH kinase family protein [Prevotella sp.]|nr:CotH kinase family protein [Prevotella sp.]
MRLRTLLTAFLIITCKAVSAQQWIDITDIYLTNPSFNGNSTTGWTWQSNAGSQTANYETFEFWNGTFDIWQIIQVPAGKYRLKVQAFYRSGDHDTSYAEYQSNSEQLKAFIYANQTEQLVSSIYTSYTNYDYGGSWRSPDRRYYPNGMQSGSAMFAEGSYENQIEFNMPATGELRLGIKCPENDRYGNWIMMDNFRLEYYGTNVKVSSIKLSSASLTIGVGDKSQLKATISPSNALNQKLTWSSSNASVVQVDEKGMLTAVATGSATITVTANDGSGVKATCAVTVTKNEATAGSLIINELQAANIDMFVDPSFNYGSWIELYNPTSQSITLQGLYISDDANNLKQHKLDYRMGSVPTNGFKVIWFDHYSKYAPTQIDSKLDYDGGAIYISNEKGEVLAFQSYPEAVTRTSYARQTDGGSAWGVTATPTPGKSNNGSTFTYARLDAPVVDTDACLFTSPFTVKVDIPAGTTLRFTADGSTPTLTNGRTSTDGVFNVIGTTTYRFRLFQDGYLPSRVVTRSYIKEDRTFNMPVISVVTERKNLYDDSLGIYIKGVNGRTGNGQASPCNWNMDWDRPVNFEYITTDGQMVINQEANMEMCGGWSRAWTPHSFKIKANKIYEGENYLPYQIFPNKTYLKHKTLQIRNGGNDTDCRIKDPALQTIVHSSGIDMDGQECQPVAHFINGEYKGMLNIREPNNKHFVEANYALDDDEIDQFEMSPDSNYVQKCGTDESFMQWYNLSANAADASTYEQIRQMVDIDEYINYMAVEFYLGGTDWPQNNIKGFKPRKEGGKFRFVLFDLDGTFATTDVFNTFEYKQYNHVFDLIYDTGERITGEIKWVTIFLNMLQNEQFRKQFIDTYCLVTGSVFEPQRCNAIIDSMATYTERVLSYEGKSPWGTANSLKNNLRNRQQTMINSLANYRRMQLSGVKQHSVSLSSNLPEARLLVNNLPVPTGKFSGTLFGDITLRAEAPAGYRFAGWTNNSGEAVALFSKGSEWQYYDKGSLDGENWQTGNGWTTGYAPLGYFTSDASNGRGYQTFLDYGSDAGNKRPTYYFRKSFTLNYQPESNAVIMLNYTIDDGMIVYVNGKEAARYQMPDGNVTYNSFASTYANGNPDNGSIQLSASLFKKGENIIAVEVHNNNGTSTDIYFDAELTIASMSNSNNFISTDKEMKLPEANSLQLMAVFEEMSDAEQTAVNAVPVRINEISSDNGIYVNATYFKKNDWIELYNTTSKAVDVAGMYLTDKIDNPRKYQIPSIEGINTVIPAHGYLVIWADKLEPVAQLHTQFKLDDEGGSVMLTSADEAWRDTLFYPQHADNVTVGLYPDGGNDVYVMNLPTIGASNRISSYAEFLIESELPSGIEQIRKPEGTNLYATYRNGQLTIMGEESARVAFSLYAATGQNVLTTSTVLIGGQATIPVSGISSGIYIIHLHDNHGNVFKQKIIVR